MRKPDQPVITLAQAKLHLRVDFDDDDDLINAIITVAQEYAEERLGRTLINTGWRLTVDQFSPAIELPNPPCISVQAVSYIDSTGTERTLDPCCYLLDSVAEPAYLVPAPGYSWPASQDRINAVWVDYSAGYGSTAANVPTPIVQWCKLAIGDMYENRNRSSDKPSVPQNFADALLDTYRMWGV
jgi:uncharacterized phiE125 gp8 family phage protein